MKSQVMEEQALKVATRESSRGRGRGRGGMRRRGRSGGRRSFDKSIIECYHCHKLGHFQYECPNKGSDAKANYVEGDDEMLLMAYLNDKEASNEECWFIDSGRSNHMCGKWEVFFDLNESFREKVKLGDNSNMNVMGKGTVYILLAEKGLEILIKHGLCKIFHPKKGLIIELVVSSNRMFRRLTSTLSWKIQHDFGTTDMGI
ncbi:hypothetical protein CR513_11605, partial [Mucuna pruriens]